MRLKDWTDAECGGIIPRIVVVVLKGGEMDLTSTTNWKKKKGKTRMKEIVCLCFLLSFLFVKKTTTDETSTKENKISEAEWNPQTQSGQIDLEQIPKKGIILGRFSLLYQTFFLFLFYESDQNFILT